MIVHVVVLSWKFRWAVPLKCLWCWCGSAPAIILYILIVHNRCNAISWHSGSLRFWFGSLTKSYWDLLLSIACRPLPAFPSVQVQNGPRLCAFTTDGFICFCAHTYNHVLSLSKRSSLSDIVYKYTLFLESIMSCQVHMKNKRNRWKNTKRSDNMLNSASTALVPFRPSLCPSLF